MFRFLYIPFLALSLNSTAQDLVIYGRVREHERPVPIQRTRLAVSADGVHQFDLLSDTTGYYRVTVDVGKIWRIRYAAPGVVAKIVEWDLRNSPKNDGGHSMNVDVRLFREDPSMDFSFLEEPIGTCRYDSVSTLLKWDMDYIRPRTERLNSLMPERYELEPDTIPTVTQGK